MTDSSSESRLGGGIFLAIGPLAGLGVGFMVGEPSMGVIGGIAAGILAATAFWALRR